ncbi:response regulator (plasmid) [Paenibacillus rhizovicinus]|uniref:Response regulator n=1 Tax=Paenibacillus rhizovicinus TaxID=2704463 RepID=A0A6C0PAK2_9BACL|nr:response regulator [Paenibacillus rhizovicinus]QHW35519.1 response regulator [Paenibacillus rhizovicinus]
MYRLLIVDDEPYIVNGMHVTFQECTHLELDIYLALSAEEAIAWLNKTRIDIILSDIRMPGMTGIELQEIVARQWPDCKMIFLSGYNEFEYVQSAIRNQGADYLLKTEGEEAIIQAVERVIRRIEEEREMKSAVHDVRKQLRSALPVLQKDYLIELLKGEISADAALKKRLSELQIGLSAELPVMAAVGRIDDWNQIVSSFDKDLILYAVQNIAQEFISSGSRFTGVMIDKVKFVWIFQPLARDEQPQHDQLRIWVRFVQGTLETIQRTCRELLQVTFSLACSGSATTWERLSIKYEELSRLLGSGLGNNQEMLLFEQDSGDKPKMTEPDNDLGIRSVLNRLDLIETYLDNGSEAEFDFVYRQIEEKTTISYPVFLEFYFGVVSAVISHLNRWSSLYQSADIPDIERLVRIDGFVSRGDAIASLREFCKSLFAIRQKNQRDKTKEIVLRINQYIEEHIDGDLSLTRLSGLVYLSPEYLSRLYKQISGIGISEQITGVRMAKARLLLKDTNLKIHEIARIVGYESAPTFTRFFKKTNFVTPQEYRDRFVTI